MRPADELLLENLQRGQFCYVLDTRQIGKSSLMVRTASRLRREGFRVAALDLSSFGANLSEEQWFFSLLARLATSLDPENRLSTFWKTHREIPPGQRFWEALHMGLPGELVIFLDEIDAVRRLPFSVQGWFGGMHETENRLTLCVLGTADPGELVSDTRFNPFPGGRRIVLTDFQEAELQPFCLQLGVNKNGAGQIHTLMERVFYWTNGHPYLTQRLCKALVEPQDQRPLPPDPYARVDACCHQLFLSHAARETNDNMAFVRSRLLRSGTNVETLLQLYRCVHQGKAVLEDDINPQSAILHLSGIAKPDTAGHLRVRNPIYAQVFDEH